MTHDVTETADILRTHVRAIAVEAADGGGSREEKTLATIKGIAALLDGKRSGFPPCRLHASPHPDDADFHRQQGTPWHDGSEPFPGPFESAVRALSAGRSRSWTTECQALPAAESRDMMASLLVSYAGYWAENGDTDRHACDGAAFSALAVFDGGSTAMPMIDIRLAPRPGVVEDLAPDGVPFEDGMLIEASLHDGYYAQDAEEIEPQ